MHIHNFEHKNKRTRANDIPGPLDYKDKRIIVIIITCSNITLFSTLCNRKSSVNNKNLKTVVHQFIIKEGPPSYDSREKGYACTTRRIS